MEKISRETELRESYAEIFVDAFREELAKLVDEPPEMKLDFYESKPLNINGIAIVIGLTGTPSGRFRVKFRQKNFPKTLRKTRQVFLFDAEPKNSMKRLPKNI